MATAKSKKKGSPSKKPAKKSKTSSAKRGPSAKAKSKRTAKPLTDAQKYTLKMMALSRKTERAGVKKPRRAASKIKIGSARIPFTPLPALGLQSMGLPTMGMGTHGGFVGPTFSGAAAPFGRGPAIRRPRGVAPMSVAARRGFAQAHAAAKAPSGAAAAVSAMADQCKDVIGKLEKSQRKVAKLEADLKEAKKRKRAGTAKPKAAKRSKKPGKGVRAKLSKQMQQKAKRPTYQSVDEALKARVRGALIKGHPGTKKCKVCGKAHKASQCWSHVAGLGGRGPKGYVAKRSGR